MFVRGSKCDPPGTVLYDLPDPLSFFVLGEFSPLCYILTRRLTKRFQRGHIFFPVLALGRLFPAD